MSRLFVLLVVVLVVFIALPKWFSTNTSGLNAELRKLEVSIREAEQKLSDGYNTNPSQRGYMQVFGSSKIFEDELVRYEINKLPITQRSFSYLWRWEGIEQAAETAYSTDGQHYFVNSYLIGFAPFQTDQPWVPLLTLAHRKSYQYDDVTYPGLKDVWQNSKDAFVQLRGDCEDHAILLADWLIDMGIDARVVVGTYKGQGHAWVIAILDDKEYLLEATNKRKTNRWNAYPLAFYETDYRPVAQFNREFFWVYESPIATTRYRGANWVLKSKFVRSG
jgi:transglutaminase-like putative cysteine protease